MASSVFFPPNKAVDTNGEPSSGAKAYFYETGTTTPLSTYSDAALTTLNAVPVVADSSGMFPEIFTDGSVDVKADIFDANDVRLPGFPLDPCIFKGEGSSASSISFTPTERISATDVQAAIVEVDASVEALEGEIGAVNTIYATGGSSNAYTLTVSGVTSYTTGDTYRARFDRANSGAATLNVSSLGVKNIKKIDTSNAVVDLVASDIPEGSVFDLYYDGTQFLVVRSYGSAVETIWETGTDATPYIPRPSDIKAAFDTNFAADFTASAVGAKYADVGEEDIGSVGFFLFSGGSINPGSTTAASNLKWGSVTGGGSNAGSAPASGTWMALSYHDDATARFGTFKRVL